MFGCFNGKPVEQLDMRDGSVIHVWPSATAAGRALGVDHSHLSRAARGEHRTSGGYGWRYLD